MVRSLLERHREGIERILEVLGRGRRFLALPHVNIDGDDLGSMLALHYAFARQGKECYLYSPDKVPEIYQFLPDWELITSTPPEGRFDAVLALECANPERLPRELAVRELSDVLINIDHHPDNTFYGDLNLVDPVASAVGEVVFGIISEMGTPIDENIARALYVAILTDTGSFQFANVTSETHRIVGELLHFTIDAEKITRRVYREKEFAVMKLYGRLLGSLERSEDGSIIWACLTRAMLEDLGVTDEDTQHFSEDLNQVKGAEIMVLFKETRNGGYKASLRSTGFPVNEAAAQFGGGGHRQAAGCTIQGDYESVKRKLFDALETVRKRTA